MKLRVRGKNLSQKWGGGMIKMHNIYPWRNLKAINEDLDEASIEKCKININASSLFSSGRKDIRFI